jgi:hypothetical protein
MIGDSEAFQIHVAEPGAELGRLPLGIESDEDDRHAHQPQDQGERCEPQLDAKIHCRVLSNLAEELSG